MTKNLRNPPIGGNVRPWEALGISRATWYRAGKPKTKPRNDTLKKLAADISRITHGRYSVRALQRDRFVQRYGIDALHGLMSGDMLLTPSIAENVAKWSHADQEVFVDILLKRLELSPKLEQITERQAEKLGPQRTLLFEVGRNEVRKQARDVYNMCVYLNGMTPEEFKEFVKGNSQVS